MIVDQTVKRVNPIFKSLKSAVDKGSKRIPKAHQTERAVKPHWDKARMALLQGIKSKKAFDEKVQKAKKDAKTVLQG